MKIKKALLIPSLLVLNNNCPALDWYTQGNAVLTNRYTDNLRLSQNPTRDNLISTLSPSAIFGFIESNQEFSFKSSLNQFIYYGESNLDFLEKIGTLNYYYRGEKWNTNFVGRYGEESSFDYQLGVTGSGNLLIQVPRYTLSLSPTFNYNLTEKDSLQITGTYTNLKYGSLPFGSGLGFSPYENDQLSTALTHRYSERLSLNINAGYNKYDANGTFAGNLAPTLVDHNNPNNIYEPFAGNTFYQQNSTTLSYQVGFNYKFDEKTTLVANGGIRNSQTHSVNNAEWTDPNTPSYYKNCNGNFIYYTSTNTPWLTCPTALYEQNATTNGKLYSATFTRLFETGDLNLFFNQQLNPASTGSQQQTTQFQLTFNYFLDDRWNVGLNSSYLISKYLLNYSGVTTAVGNNNRTLITIAPNISWKWTPEMNFQLTYTYQDQMFTVQNQSAIGDSVQLQFNYQPLLNRQVK